jgi:RND family efflux transporter MFP subunit
MHAHGRVRLATAGRAALALVCLAVLLAGLAACRPGTADPTLARPEPPRPVSIAIARTRAVPLEMQASGFVVSEHVVQVRPQISGLLRRVFFTEGQAVRAGQRLFLIDPAPFEADLAAAGAARDSARANLQRLQGLVEGHYVTPQDYINARAAAGQADAAYRRAEINLSYTDIRASVTGRSGGLTTRTGNLVAPSDATPLVTINQTRPIEVQFALAQQFLPRLWESMAQGAIPVAVLREDSREELDRGEVVFTDNAVNAGTGTLTLKARMPNEREQLWPGQYVDVRLQLGVEPRALTVPETAVQTGASGNYVYVVSGGEASRREVSVNRHAGELAVIATGLSDGEQVVERVPAGLRPGMRVTRRGAEPAPRALVRLPEPGS